MSLFVILGQKAEEEQKISQRKLFGCATKTRPISRIGIERKIQSKKRLKPWWNMFIMVPTRVEVSSDLAERYGYADDVTDGVSALDVLVKYHELTFGEDFTKDSKSDYLVVSNGTITTVNGEKTSAFSFAVNGEFPCDKNGEYNTQYGYTGYTISQTPVAEDGTVEFFFYQDTSMYMDYYTWFTDTDGNRLDTFTVQAGTDFTLGMDGYMYAYAGTNILKLAPATGEGGRGTCATSPGAIRRPEVRCSLPSGQLACSWCHAKPSIKLTCDWKAEMNLRTPRLTSDGIGPDK